MLSLCRTANLFDYKAKEERALTVLHQARHQGAHDSSSTRGLEDSHPWARKDPRVRPSYRRTWDANLSLREK